MKTNVSVLCLYLSLELKEMIRKRKEKKLVKSKRKVSCFGCHFKIKNFTMSTCLLLLYCYVPQSMIKIISWNRFHGKTCRGKNFYPPSSCHLLSIVAPPPLLLLCPIFVYMHQKNITFSAAKIHGNIFLSRILTSNIYALSLNPHKKKLRETTLGKKI